MKCNMNLHNGIESHKQTTNLLIEFRIHLKNTHIATTMHQPEDERKNQHIGRIIAYIFESLAVNQLIQAIAIDTVQFLFPSLPFCTVCREAFRPINANFSCAYVLECIVLWMNLYQPKKTLEKASTLFKLLIEKFIRSITSLSFIWRAKKKKSYD